MRRVIRGEDGDAVPFPPLPALPRDLLLDSQQEIQRRRAEGADDLGRIARIWRNRYGRHTFASSGVGARFPGGGTSRYWRCRRPPAEVRSARSTDRAASRRPRRTAPPGGPPRTRALADEHQPGAGIPTPKTTVARPDRADTGGSRSAPRGWRRGSPSRRRPEDVVTPTSRSQAASIRRETAPLIRGGTSGRPPADGGGDRVLGRHREIERGPVGEVDADLVAVGLEPDVGPGYVVATIASRFFRRIFSTGCPPGRSSPPRTRRAHGSPGSSEGGEDVLRGDEGDPPSNVSSLSFATPPTPGGSPPPPPPSPPRPPFPPPFPPPHHLLRGPHPDRLHERGSGSRTVPRRGSRPRRIAARRPPWRTPSCRWTGS